MLASGTWKSQVASAYAQTGAGGARFTAWQRWLLQGACAAQKEILVCKEESHWRGDSSAGGCFGRHGPATGALGGGSFISPYYSA